ncbi:MAG: hypothetical protein RIR00_1371 [Pseudomonadota bacterium]|jgi:hypothetical protein
MGVVFVKTQKGHDEIEKRLGGLSPRVRRVLIFVDGKRTVEDLRNMLAADDLTHTLGMLEEEGYIDLAAVVDKQGVAAPPPTRPMPSITAFRTLTASEPAQNLGMARNFMINTLNAFVGSLGATTLLEHLEEAETHEALRALYDEWYHTLVSSREGKREAESLREKLLKVI